MVAKAYFQSEWAREINLILILPRSIFLLTDECFPCISVPHIAFYDYCVSIIYENNISWLVSNETALVYKLQTKNLL